MRVVAAILILLIATAAHASVTAKIESIGFDSFIRPDCWIPLVVQTNSDEDSPRAFDLQIVQYDLDGDQVVYTRPVTVNPGVQSFWACFKPEPINDGIPATGTPNQSDLAKRLRIFLHTPSAALTDGRVAQVATAGNLPQGLEYGSLNSSRGQKLILVIGRSPQVGEYKPGGDLLLGTMEDTLFVRVQPKALPVDALGYDAVDAIVWTDADIERLEPGQLRAMRQYVHAGGRLVVVQNAETQRMSKLDEFLPVRVGEIVQTPSLDPLKTILTPPKTPVPLDVDNLPIDLWRRINGPFSIAKSTPLPDTVVDTWMTWPDKTQTPYIARRLYGNGCVSWIAQDISEPAVTSQTFGWPRLWERLMDWRDVEMTFPTTLSKDESISKPERERLANKFNNDVSRNLGASFLGGMDLASKTAALISLAFVFFIGYWCLAGPGSYFLLVAKKRAHWSWFVFGGIALVATVLTVAVTQLVLRGTAQIHHLSLARINSGGDEPAYVQSRFGIYIPRDENAAITLTDRDTSAASAMTPLVIDPRFSGGEVSLRDSSYAVPVEADDAGPTVELSVPFRSTLKKLQATWAGKPAGRISGRPVLMDATPPISGSLSNNTGQDLTNVIMIFRRPKANGRTADWFLALPNWKNGLTLNLAQEWDKAISKPSTAARPAIPVFNLEKSQCGAWEYAENWLMEDLRRGMVNQFNWDDSSAGYARSFPLVSLFDRCTPMVNQGTENDRIEFVRRGVRQWDCSAAIAGGAMVILAQADGAVPLPLTVDGEKPEGTGHMFFQCIVPMDQSHFDQPPATQPTQVQQ